MTRVSGAVVFAVLSLLTGQAARAQGEESGADKSAEGKSAEAEGQAAEQANEPREDEPPRESAESAATGEPGEMIETGSPKGRMTLPGGGFQFSAVVEANLGESKIGKPISVAPDLWIGLQDRLTFGIYHSGRAATGFLSGVGTGLCFRDGMSGTCKAGLGDIYTFVGSELRIGLTHGGFATALVLGGNAKFFDPEKLFAGKAGFHARIHTKWVGIELSPTVSVGLNKRDLNGDQVFVPVTFYLRFAPRVSLALQGGFATTLKNAGDNYRVPAAAGLSFWLGNHVSIDAAFGLAAVLDKDDMTKAFDQRSATVGLSYAR